MESPRLSQSLTGGDERDKELNISTELPKLQSNSCSVSRLVFPYREMNVIRTRYNGVRSYWSWHWYNGREGCEVDQLSDGDFIESAKSNMSYIRVACLLFFLLFVLFNIGHCAYTPVCGKAVYRIVRHHISVWPPPLPERRS